MRIDPIFLDAKFYVLQRTILRRQSLVRCVELMKRVVECRRIWNLKHAKNIVVSSVFKLRFVCELILIFLTQSFMFCAAHLSRQRFPTSRLIKRMREQGKSGYRLFTTRWIPFFSNALLKLIINPSLIPDSFK